MQVARQALRARICRSSECWVDAFGAEEQNMYKILKEKGHYFIYHFTDTDNIESIKANKGILSFYELKKLNLKNVKFGGNDWSHEADELSHVDDYVHLCFLNNHPMEYRAREDGRIKNTKWLQINIDILLTEGIMYTSDVSNKSGVKLLTKDVAVERLDHEAICSFLDFSIAGNHERKCNAEKYEILVPKIVPLSYIRNI